MTVQKSLEHCFPLVHRDRRQEDTRVDIPLIRESIRIRFDPTSFPLRELCLSRSDLNESDLDRVLQLYRSHSHSLRVLDLSQNPGLGAHGARLFAEELHNNRQLRSFHWSDNNADGTGMSKLSSLLLHTNIEEFYLARNRAGPRGLVDLFVALQSASSITLLDLQGNGFNREAMDVLVETLAAPSCCLSYLLLAYDDLTADACRNLFRCLRTNQNLLRLRIQGGPSSIIDDMFSSELQSNILRRQHELEKLLKHSTGPLKELHSELFEPYVVTMLCDLLMPLE